MLTVHFITHVKGIKFWSFTNKQNILRLSKGDASALVCTYVYNVIVVTKNHEKMQLVTLKIVDLEFYAILANFVSERKKSEKSPTVQKLKYLAMKAKNRQPCIFCNFLKGQENGKFCGCENKKSLICSCARECHLKTSN